VGAGCDPRCDRRRVDRHLVRRDVP
jgi:hypothetical protein